MYPQPLELGHTGLEADEEANFLCTQSTVLLLPAHTTWGSGSGLGEFQNWYGVPVAGGARTEAQISVAL